MCAGAWTRCCSGDAGSTEVVSHASGASFVDARQRSPTLVDASQRRLPTTFLVWGRLTSVSGGIRTRFPIPRRLARNDGCPQRGARSSRPSRTRQGTGSSTSLR